MSALKDAPDGQVELITHSTEEACDSDGHTIQTGLVHS